jgi:hypothetical protein
VAQFFRFSFLVNFVHLFKLRIEKATKQTKHQATEDKAFETQKSRPKILPAILDGCESYPSFKGRTELSFTGTLNGLLVCVLTT